MASAHWQEVNHNFANSYFAFTALFNFHRVNCTYIFCG